MISDSRFAIADLNLQSEIGDLEFANTDWRLPICDCRFEVAGRQLEIADLTLSIFN